MRQLQEWQGIFEQAVNRELENQAKPDSAHDMSHLQRVWKHCDWINREDGLDVEPLVLLAAAYFHDIVNVPKDSSERSQASRLAAQRAKVILGELSFPETCLEETLDAIRCHSFSAQLQAKSTAARIVQDADRLEALGALGIARVFCVAGQMNSKLFDPVDPFANERELDDRQYALDHFFVKLLKIKSSMNTDAGRRRAGELTSRLENFMADLGKELE